MWHKKDCINDGTEASAKLAGQNLQQHYPEKPSSEEVALSVSTKLTLKATMAW